jgi:hypothetical protein
MNARRYSAFGWIVWKIMGRVARRKAARNRARITALALIGLVLGAGAAGARAKRGH